MIRDYSKFFGFLLVGCSFFVAIIQQLTFPFIGKIYCQDLLGLSSWGLKHGFLWQIITYSFIYPLYGRFNLGYLCNLIMLGALFWKAAEMLIYCKGERPYVRFLFSSILFVGFLTAGLLLLTNIPYGLVGCSALLFSLYTALICLAPMLQYGASFTGVLQARWLVLIVMGGLLLTDLLDGAFVNLWAKSLAILYAYLYSVIIWRNKSPFSALNGFEHWVLHRTARFSHVTHSRYTIYANEESFVEKCLQKISRCGKASLTLYERFRLWCIALRKKRRQEAFRKRYEEFRDR